MLAPTGRSALKRKCLGQLVVRGGVAVTCVSQPAWPYSWTSPPSTSTRSMRPILWVPESRTLVLSWEFVGDQVAWMSGWLCGWSTCRSRS
jgi:hypothetical protein